jgi:hypothetical protein
VVREYNGSVLKIGSKFILTLSPPLNQAKIGGFGGLQFSEKGDEGIAASPRINHFVQNFAENTMVKSAIF